MPSEVLLAAVAFVPLAMGAALVAAFLAWGWWPEPEQPEAEVSAPPAARPIVWPYPNPTTIPTHLKEAA